MKEIFVAVSGPDSFGVVYTTAAALGKMNCSFIDMNQTTVRNQFSSIMIIKKPDSLTNETVAENVSKALKDRGFDMSVTVRDYVPGDATITTGEPFVVTVDGEDSKGILEAFTRIFFDSKINIDSFRSIENFTDDLGNKVEGRILLVFEVTVPTDIDIKALHRTLADISKEKHLSMSMQHRRIFEAVHRVNVA